MFKETFIDFGLLYFKITHKVIGVFQVLEVFPAALVMGNVDYMLLPVVRLRLRNLPLTPRAQ